MENKLINKTIIFLFCLIAGVTFSSCNDWTETESLTIVDPNIKEQNPELYARYLEDLRNYKNSHHKIVYAWFDNSRKSPSSRGHHINDLPDSIDVVVMMYPDSLIDRELDEINTVRQDKGTKFIFTLSYDAIKSNYEAMVKAIEESESETTEETKDFISYLVDTLQYTLKLVDKYNYDGIAVGYNGKSTIHMTDKEKEEYVSNEKAYIGIVSIWINSHKDKVVVFEGKPQNLVDKTILSLCKHIIIPTSTLTNGSAINYNIQLANVNGVPSDRFIITAATASINVTDTKTGYWTDGTRALTSSATWAAATYSDFTIAGLGILNINNDYFNIIYTYEYSKKAIDILNPSLKSK